MEQFTINTSQNISIEQPLASIGERIIANLIDYAIMGAYYFVTMVITGLAKNQTILLIFSIPVLLYHLIFEQFMNGQSPGKNVMNIRVYNENGTSASFVSIFIRWVFRLVDIALLFGSVATVFIVGTKKNQRLGDIVGKTILLRTKQKKVRGSMFLKLPQNYSMQFPEVEMLEETDIRTINEVIQFLQNTNQNQESQLFALKTKDAVSKKMGIRSDLKPVQFLITIMKDYNYLHTQQMTD
ncbi:RDD family protein [Saccharicrinis sp. FJH54]|uniref:RDD family protein n=1 Tax=Saccharicrinis sp. FJH54 TaxID=3344665 RepID=UPI0035D3DDFA